MSARELRAEARAWRRRAREADRLIPAREVYFVTARDVRWLRCGGPRTSLMNRDELTMFCLLLALECEDEARALGRGGR